VLLLAALFLGQQQVAVAQPAIAAHDQAQEADAPPPGREAEDEQQQVGQPGAGAAAEIGDLRHRAGVRPARIGLAVAGQDQDEIRGQHGNDQPARFGQQAHQAVRQRLRHAGIAGVGGIARFAHRRCEDVRWCGETAVGKPSGPVPFIILTNFPRKHGV
jgi:hypothetical protein